MSHPRDDVEKERGFFDPPEGASDDESPMAAAGGETQTKNRQGVMRPGLLSSFISENMMILGGLNKEVTSSIIADVEQQYRACYESKEDALPEDFHTDEDYIIYLLTTAVQEQRSVTTAVQEQRSVTAAAEPAAMGGDQVFLANRIGVMRVEVASLFLTEKQQKIPGKEGLTALEGVYKKAFEAYKDWYFSDADELPGNIRSSILFLQELVDPSLKMVRLSHPDHKNPVADFKAAFIKVDSDEYRSLGRKRDSGFLGKFGHTQSHEQELIHSIENLSPHFGSAQLAQLLLKYQKAITKTLHHTDEFREKKMRDWLGEQGIDITKPISEQSVTEDLKNPPRAADQTGLGAGGGDRR
jgi:hypothetical protein